MNTSGEAADQVMRMMLNGAEVLIKLSGSGAKNAAVLLYSIARQQKKTKGAARLDKNLRAVQHHPHDLISGFSGCVHLLSSLSLVFVSLGVLL